MSRYVAIVDGGPGAYGVSFPDAPGCVAMGETVDEAIRNAGAALAEWSADVLADGGQLPPPRELEELQHDDDVLAILAEGPAVFAVIPLVLNSGKPARANISLDTGLLQAIDETASRLGLTRSAFLATAAREKIDASF
jgi:predicted RNase H-like HicB family nuclease